MNAPTYIEKNLGKKRDEEKKYEMHTKKLKEIQDRDAKKLKATTTTSTNIGKKIKETKDKTQGFMKNEKNAAINRENKILLDKLVEISNGKFSSVTKAKKKKTKKAVQSKKSLNYEKRKKEFERIERENMAIAQRLYNKESSISKKKMDKDYHTHKKYKKQIQKLEAAEKKRKAKKNESDSPDKGIEEEKGLEEEDKEGDEDKDEKDDQNEENGDKNSKDGDNQDDKKDENEDKEGKKDDAKEGEGEGDDKKDKNHADYEPDYKIE